jgi:hypothetical protein
MKIMSVLAIMLCFTACAVTADTRETQSELAATETAAATEAAIDAATEAAIDAATARVRFCERTYTCPLDGAEFYAFVPGGLTYAQAQSRCVAHCRRSCTASPIVCELWP